MVSLCALRPPTSRGWRGCWQDSHSPLWCTPRPNFASRYGAWPPRSQRSRSVPNPGRAVLSGVGVACVPDAVHGGFEVRVVEDHDRSLAAEIEVYTLECLRGGPGYGLACGDVAGQRDHVHAGMLHDTGADQLTVPRNDVEDAAGKDVGSQLGHL